MPGLVRSLVPSSARAPSPEPRLRRSAHAPRSRSFVLAFLLAAPAAAQIRSPTQSDQVVEYQISVTLDPATHQLTGTEPLTWRNPSATDAVAELWFHLYLNAFKNTKSTFMQGVGRPAARRRDGQGRVGLDRHHVDEDGRRARTSKPTLAFDQPGRRQRRRPDGGRASRCRSRCRRAGRSRSRSRSRRSCRRCSRARATRTTSTWSASGSRSSASTSRPACAGATTGGWNCHQFHANSEFYADFGSYNVDITVPSRLRARRHRRAERRARRTATARPPTRYEQADVHDFAWTADPDYVVVKATFSATKDVTPAEYQRVGASCSGRTLDEVKLSDVEITVLLQPDHAPQAQRHIDAAKAGAQVVRPVVRAVSRTRR